MATVTHERVSTGRGYELVLLILAVGMGIFAYIQVGLAMNEQVPTNIVVQASVFTALAVLVHLLVRWKAPYADPVILPTAVALTGIGLAAIYRLDLSYAARGADSGFANRQLVWMLLGMVAATVVVWLFRDHRIMKRYTYLFLLAGLALLLLPLVPGLGRTINGSRIWIGIGDLVSFQPGELAKICLAIFFAGYLVDARDNLALAGPRVLGIQFPRIRDLGPILVAWAMAVFVLVFQRDLGTSLLFFGFFVAMLYVATERLSWIGIGLLLFAGGAYAAAQAFPHVMARVDVWIHALDPEMYHRSPGGSYQVVQGLFGMANGGLFGAGWGEGYPYLVPYANSDFIWATLGEELGLTGVLAVLAMYLVFTERGIRTGIGVRDGFGKLLCGGLAFVVAFQTFVVIGGVTRLIPLTGLTLPFMAYGGSSLVSNWIIVGLLLRISNEAREPAPEPAPLNTEALAAVLTADSGDGAVSPQTPEIAPDVTRGAATGIPTHDEVDIADTNPRGPVGGSSPWDETQAQPQGGAEREAGAPSSERGRT
ncbi:MAG TPA: FtsW/RodA/SpoVE family cell cycle protein [Actinomycetales bacterium]|nr:FtsW/RodA/SpoVE family cell cycle protein [Actinomycetales bacterium]